MALVFIVRTRHPLFMVTFFCLALNGCTGLFFQPMKPLIRTPADINLQYQSIQFTSQDGTELHGWFLPAQEKALGTILLLHGNAENISTHIGSVYWLPPRGFNVFLFDYRGYGASAGIAEIQGAFQDIKAAFQWLQNNPAIDSSRIAILGQSLGGAMGAYVFTHLGQSASIRALILDSAFSDYQQIVREKLASFWLTWPLQYPLSWLVTGRYSPIEAISQYSPTPVLIIHTANDGIIPVHHAQQLFEQARPPKDIWIIPKGGHISALKNPGVRNRLIEYLSGIMENPS